MSTNWSSPKTNIFTAVNDLRKCLASGYKARLIRMKNEDCAYPIMNKHQDSDFRNYWHRVGYATSVNKIKADPNMSEFEKHLALNYVSCFGTPEAVKRYYETGELTDDNFKGTGVSHLVNVDDLLKFLEVDNCESGGHVERAILYRQQYHAPEHVNDTSHFFDFFSYKHGSPFAIKKFRRKLWVVEMIRKEDQQPRIPVMTRILMSLITALAYPLKFIPERRVLRMDEYKVVTYRIGAVVNGFSIDIHIPKKFGFK